MAERKGKNGLLQVEVSPGVFQTVAGIQNVSISSNVELIETTNYQSNERKQYLEEAGIENTTISGSGIATDEATFSGVEDKHRAKSPVSMRLFFSDLNPVIYSGEFMIPSLEFSATYNGTVTFSFTLESQGEVTKS